MEESFEWSGLLHVPVMAEAVVDHLIKQSTRIIVDCTFGTGGHSLELLKRAPDSAFLIGIDLDDEALEIGSRRLSQYRSRILLKRGNFGQISTILGEYAGMVDALLIDCGVSRLQVIKPQRGFSFDREGPLDMRFDRSSGIDASRFLSQISFEQLSDLLLRFGEKRGKEIARAILERREKGAIRTTSDLADAVKSVVRFKVAKSLARVFLAIRASANKELENLANALDSLPLLMNKGGRVCVISYHSLEDKIVKDAFRKYSGRCICPPGSLSCTCGRVEAFRVVTKKPLKPGSDEVRKNPWARSAKMRVMERCD